MEMQGGDFMWVGRQPRAGVRQGASQALVQIKTPPADIPRTTPFQDCAFKMWVSWDPCRWHLGSAQSRSGGRGAGSGVSAASPTAQPLPTCK